MSLKDFIEHRERYSQHSAREDRSDETYYEDRTPSRGRVDEDDDDGADDVLKEIDFYKQRLYKKIDSCFVRFGLEGLRRIDEGIAHSLADYIADLKGVPRQRREAPPVQEAAPAPVQQAAPQKPFTPPKRIVENPQPVQQPRPAQSGPFNMDIIDKVLNDIIPPTQIHEVHINSNIPIDQIMAERQARGQKVDLAPQPQMAEAIEGDSMVEVGSNGEEIGEVPMVAPEPVQAAPVEVAPVAPQSQGTYDIANDMLDKRTVQEAESISLMAPMPEWNPSMDDNSEDELNAPIVESEVQTPIEVKPTKRPRKKKG